MPNYRRPHLRGQTWFFTVVTHCRQPLLSHPRSRSALRSAIKAVLAERSFRIDAWVLLPDHMHCIWTLPEDDGDFATRWSQVKRIVAQDCRPLVNPSLLTPGMRRRGEIGFWQPRYWEHAIRNSPDLMRHLDYIHYNPVKHGMVRRAIDWPHSTFHRFVRHGLYREDWGVAGPIEGEFGE